MKYTIKFDLQGLNFEYSKLDALAALVVEDEAGNELTRCPDCLLFQVETIGNKDYSQQDFQRQLANGMFKYLWKVRCKSLEDCTITETLKNFSETPIDLKSIIKEFRRQVKTATKLFMHICTA